MLKFYSQRLILALFLVLIGCGTPATDSISPSSSAAPSPVPTSSPSPSPTLTPALLRSSQASFRSRVAGAPFVHPGALNNQADLDFTKVQIAAGKNPWARVFNEVKLSALRSNRTTAPTTETAQKLDGRRAYANALAWTYTGEVQYAENAIGILNVWGKTFTGYSPAEGQNLLVAGWTGSLLGPAAELMRNYPGWAPSDRLLVQTMFREKFYPALNTMSTWNGNVDLTQIDAMLSIAVFNDDEAEFDLGLQRLEARLPAYFYLEADGSVSAIAGDGGDRNQFWSNPTLWVDGLTQETCRDNGHHTQFALASALHAAEVAWNQGVDVYAEHSDRFVAALELLATQLLTDNMQGTCAKNFATSDLYDTWEIGYNHYHNRLGLSLPNTEKLITTQVRRRGMSDWNIFYETLTHAGAE